MHGKYSLSRLSVIAVITLIFISSWQVSFASNIQQIKPISVQRQLAELENASGGRIGISAIDTNNNVQIQYRAEKRFPLCSTFKIMLVSAILKQSMTNSHFLQQKIFYTRKDILAAGYAPITEKHIAGGMSIAELCAAAIDYSDNAAANFLMKKLGGPNAVTAFARSIGDTTFRLDRWEPALNTAIPGDLRDTSTPLAMQHSLQQLALGKALAKPQREQLLAWLKGNTTGNLRIRAGVPKGWVVADKTGSGDYGTTNDIGIIWPPKCHPIVLAIYFTQKKKDAVPRDDVIASATRIVVDAFAEKDSCI